MRIATLVVAGCVGLVSAASTAWSFDRPRSSVPVLKRLATPRAIELPARASDTRPPVLAPDAIVVAAEAVNGGPLDLPPSVATFGLAKELPKSFGLELGNATIVRNGAMIHAELNEEHGPKNGWITLRFNATAGKTYTFVCGLHAGEGDPQFKVRVLEVSPALSVVAEQQVKEQGNQVSFAFVAAKAGKTWVEIRSEAEEIRFTECQMAS